MLWRRIPKGNFVSCKRCAKFFIEIFDEKSYNGLVVFCVRTSLNSFPLCGGYHMRLTRARSSVQSWVETFIPSFLFRDHYLFHIFWNKINANISSHFCNHLNIIFPAQKRSIILINLIIFKSTCWDRCLKYTSYFQTLIPRPLLNVGSYWARAGLTSREARGWFSARGPQHSTPLRYKNIWIRRYKKMSNNCFQFYSKISAISQPSYISTRIFELL